MALREDHAHVVLYSERGRGKTSLANLAAESLRGMSSIVARHTCEAGTNFESLMRGLMHDLPPSLLAVRSGPEGISRHNVEADGCEAVLPSGELRPRDIVTLTQRLNCRDLIFVIDEFDRVEDTETRERLADTIKQLSDQDVSLQFFIMAVAENLDQILGQHPSIQRAVVGVHLPLFSDHDVALLITRGGRETGLNFRADVVAHVTVLARGMPYMAQLLGLRLSQVAIERGDTTIVMKDLLVAVERLIDEGNLQVLMLYALLTDHGRNAEMVQALRRVATAPQDLWGRLQVLDAPSSSVTIGGRSITAQCWERMQAVHVLQSAMPGSGMFVFGERALMHHVLLLAARDATLMDAIPTEPGAKQRTASQDAKMWGTDTHSREAQSTRSHSAETLDLTCARPPRVPG
jgi:Holliday junction resolvasome RuvABC ATP-dependent DNA helicase subunit